MCADTRSTAGHNTVDHDNVRTSLWSSRAIPGSALRSPNRALWPVGSTGARREAHWRRRIARSTPATVPRTKMGRERISAGRSTSRSAGNPDATQSSWVHTRASAALSPLPSSSSVLANRGLRAEHDSQGEGSGKGSGRRSTVAGSGDCWRLMSVSMALSERKKKMI